jgi:hypothetical protein
MAAEQLVKKDHLTVVPTNSEDSGWRLIVAELQTEIGTLKGKVSGLECEALSIMRAFRQLTADCERRINAVNTIAGRATKAAERVEDAAASIRTAIRGNPQ